MDDIGNICDFCISDERDCLICQLGNPCLNCADYDKTNGICMSKVGAAAAGWGEARPHDYPW